MIMRSIYSDGQDKTLLLYPYQNMIFFRTIIAENTWKPIMLCNDFLYSLSDSIYQDNIYYSYINKDYNIVIKSITDQSVLYQLDGDSSLTYIQPSILSFLGKLLLIYAVKNPINNTYFIKGILPFEKEQSFSVPDTFSSVSNINYLISDRLILSIYCKNQSHIYEVTKDFQCIPYKENSISEEEIKPYKDEIKQQKDIIESIKKQYEELMQTAYRYREEAIKWQNKFYSK